MSRSSNKTRICCKGMLAILLRRHFCPIFASEGFAERATPKTKKKKERKKERKKNFDGERARALAREREGKNERTDNAKNFQYFPQFDFRKDTRSNKKKVKSSSKIQLLNCESERVADL